MIAYELRELYKNYPKEFLNHIQEAVTRKENPLHLAVDSQRDKNGISIKELYYACTGKESPGEGMPVNGNLSALFEDMSGQVHLREDVASTAFAVITGNTMQQHLIAAYQAVPHIGDQLVENYPSKLKLDTITGFKSIDLPKLEIPEGTDYPDFGTTDKYVTMKEPAKFGGIIRVTRETIHYDQTGQLLDALRALGERLQAYREYRIIGGVFNAFYIAGTTSVYWPSGTAANLYASDDTYKNYVSGVNTALNLTNGITAIQTARNKFTTLAVDDSADSFPILAVPEVILAGDADADVLEVLMTSQGNPTTANLSKNPLMTARHKYTILTSRIVDYLRSQGKIDATAWLMGTPRRQFKYKEIFPFSTWISQGQDTDDGFNRDVVFRFKASEKGDVFATDTRYCVYVKGAA